MRISRAPAELQRQQPAMQPAHWPFPIPQVELQRPGLAQHQGATAWPAAPHTPTRNNSPGYHSCSPVTSPAGSPAQQAVLAPPLQQQGYPSVPRQHRRIQLVPGPPSPGTKPGVGLPQQQPQQPHQQRLHFNVPTRTRQAPRQPQHSSGGQEMQSSPAVFHPMAWLRFAANYVEHQRLLQ